ncbi:tRNA epoxyqueuosine(34) reductase QueG [Maledivibacter halophilus]|uniref:Epoxyqueuosine reductase n=1 Tax=Maledivibacter halophilus TaxID=36842 RepID=A0A1T5LIR6_9FIRM|nr:tRNA epoxyqueuosine(34) reductase QueG [Maledivibacter halophilus]SKC75872.1 epoxyqueuosine reductase [Maledivibacter halophilus]
MIFKEEIIKYSKEIGIDLIGFTESEIFHDLEAILRKREKKNLLSGFEEQNIDKRINPHLTLENSHTIIVIGMSYYVNEGDITSKDSNKPTGNVSKSSWGRDYHLVLKSKMKMLVEYIEKKTKDFQYEYFTDTGPLVDRYLAYKAGIGWYGKNNCIITKEYGSWIFIGYILSNLEININMEESKNEGCLNCNNCIKACPTGALMENQLYNPKLCISYLTQTKEDIDYKLREKMGKSLYGCDICQLVCPYNSNKTTTHKEFIPVGDNYKPNLLGLLKLSNKEFKKRFEKAALNWRGNKIIKRNALIALGNSGDKDMVKYLVEYLNSPSIMIKKYTAWAIIRLDRKKGKKILDKHLEKEKDIEMNEEIKKLYNYYLRNLHN